LSSISFRATTWNVIARILLLAGLICFSIMARFSPTASMAMASTRTAPGHATLLTAAYSDGHGILANDYWDPEQALVKDAKATVAARCRLLG